MDHKTPFEMDEWLQKLAAYESAEHAEDEDNPELVELIKCEHPELFERGNYIQFPDVKKVLRVTKEAKMLYDIIKRKSDDAVIDMSVEQNNSVSFTITASVISVTEVERMAHVIRRSSELFISPSFGGDKVTLIVSFNDVYTKVKT